VLPFALCRQSQGLVGLFNIGPTPVIDPENKAPTRSRLSHVDQNHVRADTIAAANAALVTAQSQIEPARMPGGGLLASVDGLRFVVPARTAYD
jgi:TnpA family transposase